MRATLIFVWLASCFVAFQIGRGGKRAPSSAPKPKLSEPGFQKHAIAANRKDEFNATRKLGTENRFVSYTQELDGDALARLLPEMTEKMDEKQVREVLRRVLMEVEPGPASTLAQLELVGRWAQIDPDTAFLWIDALPNPKLRHDMKRKSIGAWAAADPAATLQFLDEASDLPAAPMAAFWDGFGASRDLRASLEFIPTLLDASKDRGVSKAVQALYQNDDRAVTLWAQDLPAGAVRDQAILGIVAQWALHDADAAMTWVEKHAAPASIDGALEQVAAARAAHLDPNGVRKPVIADP